MIILNVDSSDLERGLRRLERAADLRPALRSIAAELLSQTEAAFSAQGRPRWKPSERARKDGGTTLQDSGQLAASITTEVGAHYATIGSNKPYAAIHQFGGKTRPHTIRPTKGKVLAFGGRFARQVNHPGSDIPARPYLPIGNDGKLTPDAEQSILGIVLQHLSRAAR